MGNPSASTHSGLGASAAEADASRYDLVEVWNDVVDTRQLLKAVLIGAVISVGTFLIAQSILSNVVESAAIARAYAMLAGVVGCVASGVVAALLFPPKRVVTDATGDDAWRAQIMQDLADNPATTLSESSLDPVVVSEMEELGLRKLFASHDRKTAHAAPASPAAAFHSGAAQASAQPRAKE